MNRRQWFRTSAVAAAGLAIQPGGFQSTYLTPRALNQPIRLNSNENPYGPSEAARMALTEAFDEGNLYPYRAYGGLERLIAEREGLTPDHVVLGAGSYEILRMAAMAYGLAGGEIMTAHPTFEGIASYAQTIGAYVHHVPVDDNLRFDLPAMDRRLTQRIGLVFLCNPNNPTGTLLPASDVRAFCEEASRNAVILVDEAYYELVTDPSYGSMVDLVRDGGNIIVSRTFSKVYGLAGLRIGYGLARPDIARRLRTFRTSSGVNIMAVRAAVASYQDQAFVQMSRDKISASRSFATQFVQEQGHRCAPSHTNFIFFHLGSDIETFRHKMEKQGVLVGRPFPPFLDWCRVSIGTDAEMQAFANAYRVVQG